jgi:hypothetical protein
MATRLETRETTHSLIGSDKVDGTAVYGSDQEKIGSIKRVMIDKIKIHGGRRLADRTDRPPKNWHVVGVSILEFHRTNLKQR